MPAAMATLKALVATSVVAVLAHEGQTVSESDSVTLLQGAIQEKSAKPVAEADVEPASEYNLAESLACASQEVKLPATSIEATAPTRVLTETIKSVRLTPQAESGDPPGASTLRALLEMMIIAIVLDGARRWRLEHKEEGVKQKVADLSAARDTEAAADAAWADMVKAAAAADLASFEKALKRGASVTRTDDWSCTPLHFAASGGSTAIATELLRRGAEVDALDASEDTPLHFAARAGHGCICELLLDAGAKIDAVNIRDMTPFVVAGHAKQETVCELLADRGAGVAGMADENLPPLVVSQIVRKVFAGITA